MSISAAAQEEITKKKQRLELYYKREEEMLSGGIKAYGIGSRNVERYDTALKDIQNKIAALESEIKSMQALKPRKAVGVVPRDW